MQENKYYTPESDEFRIGFEYEINTLYPIDNKDGYGWVKTSITKENWNVNMDCINLLERTRVKHLDSTDIESLGWKKISEDTYQTDAKCDRHGSCIIQLIHRGSWVLICKGYSETSFSDFETMFAGFIKNKSELFKLVKQLNING